MKINKDGINIDEYNLNLERICGSTSCRKKYRLVEYFEQNYLYFYRPHSYIQGCSEFCLECWLGVSEFIELKVGVEKVDAYDLDLKFPTNHEHWYDENLYRQIDQGDLNAAYKNYIEDGCHVALLPISRLVTDTTIFLPTGTMIYPEGRINLEKFSIVCDSHRKLSSSLTALSGLSIETLNSHPLISIPIKFSWESLFRCTHEEHMELIATISEMIDVICLDVLRYNHCKLMHIPDVKLPSAPGQISSNPMMSGAMFINGSTNEASIIGGAAFTHRITKGLGMALKQPEWDLFPDDGEVAKIALHALSLYSHMIQTQSATSRFVQALSLLEFLAFPSEYKTFKKVKGVISWYITNCPKKRQLILDRFEELTGKKDELTGEEVGLRTKIVHMGGRLELILPSQSERIKLFEELDGYLRCVIDHMIDHSHMSLIEYEEVKLQMRI